MSLTFLTPWVLAGSALVAVPIIVHLIMRKQPKHLMFPAFRFLKYRHRTNLQRLRLRHFLLLAMRILLVLLLAWALAGPELAGGPSDLATDAPIGLVMIFDTSASMEYEHAGRTRLDDAKDLAAKFLDRLPPRQPGCNP